MANALRVTTVLTCLAAMPAGAAEFYPAKPVTLVVTAAPGGVTDILARTIGQRLTQAWGQQVLVENRPGGSNQIGAEYVAKAAPDGYTLLVSPEATFVVNPWIYHKAPYDPAADFVPVTGLISISQALVANASLPVQSVKDLVELGRKKPGEMNYGTFGVASTGHLNMEMFQRMAGVSFAPVHYKGATPAFTDVMAGHIQMMFISTSSAVQPWKAGQVKLLGVGSASRLPQLPDVPTVAESGYPGFEAVSWFGLFAPRGTPRDVVVRINEEVRRLFAEPEFREKFVDANLFQPMTSTPEEFAAFIRSDAQKWKGVIADAKVKVE